MFTRQSDFIITLGAIPESGNIRKAERIRSMILGFRLVGLTDESLAVAKPANVHHK